MAQYFTDFSEYTVGQAPSDWTARLNGLQGDLTIKNDGFENYLSRASGTIGEEIYTWDAVPSSQDVEIVIEWLRDTFGNRDYSMVARADPNGNTDPSPDGDRKFCVGRYTPNNLNVVQYLASIFPTLASVSAPTSVSTRYKMRFRVSSNSYKMRRWISSDQEPTTTWDIEGTSPDLEIISGLVGIAASTLTTDNFIYFFGVGTNGDPAPTEPVSAGPVTPINLGVTNLQATSARLTWEQG